MTTLIGIRTNHGADAIVLFSDRQKTITDEEGNGEKSSIEKLFTGANWVMGDCGSDDRDVRRFYGFLRGDGRYGSNEKKAERAIKKALKRKRFYEVYLLNANLMRKEHSIEDTHAFIFAINNPELSLWLVDQMGNLIDVEDENEFDYICLGSGGEKAKTHLETSVLNGEIERDRINVTSAIYYGRRALGAAQERDLPTGGSYELIVVTPKKIEPWGKSLREKFSKFEEERLREIGNRYDAESAV